MTGATRYAIYLAPEEGSPLAQFVAGIIGYNAHSGKEVPHGQVSGFPALDWAAITWDPRRYGAHATLKAPFRLAEKTTRNELAAAIKDFAAARKVFDLGPLAITCVSRDLEGGFIALTNPHNSPALLALESETVMFFDQFRAPLSPDELARRQPDRLTDRQRNNLSNHGYPFVLEDFAFHITLTNRLPAPEGIADYLADKMAQELGTVRFRVDALYLFEQAEPGARFRVVGRFPLRA